VEIEDHVVDLAIRAPVQIQIKEPQQALPKGLHTNTEDIAEASGQPKDAGTTPLPARSSGHTSHNGKNGHAKGASGSRPRAGQSNGRHPQQSSPKSSSRNLVPAAASSGSNSKVGRNDPCYCGSGKKYKHCHGR